MSRFYDRGEEELRNIDLQEDQVSYPEAATLAGVEEPTVRQWKSRHYLAPVGKDEDGRLRFRPIDVLRVEAKTRQHRGRYPRDRQAG